MNNEWVQDTWPPSSETQSIPHLSTWPLPDGDDYCNGNRTFISLTSSCLTYFVETHSAKATHHVDPPKDISLETMKFHFNNTLRFLVDGDDIVNFNPVTDRNNPKQNKTNKIIFSAVYSRWWISELQIFHFLSSSCPLSVPVSAHH